MIPKPGQVAILVVVLLLAGYAGCYLLQLDPLRLDVLTTPIISVRESKYRVSGRVAETLFAPANWLDRRIRPDYWEFRHSRPHPEIREDNVPGDFQF
jgi:hypothetical protein